MFRSRRNHHQGAVLCLAKTTKYGFSVHIGIDLVYVMAAYRPVVQACGSLHACTTGRYMLIVCLSWNNKKGFDTTDVQCKHEQQHLVLFKPWYKKKFIISSTFFFAPSTSKNSFYCVITFTDCLRVGEMVSSTNWISLTTVYPSARITEIFRKLICMHSITGNCY
jgi:hypothetical protein